MRTSKDSPVTRGPAGRRVCLFGGSFDPVHDAHLALAYAAYAGCGLEQVVFLLARRSPHKPSLQPEPAADRLAMLRLAVSDLAWAEVSEWELHQPGPSYSWRAVEHFSAMLGSGVELCWLLGADQWEAIETWARPQLLAARLVFIVFPRGDIPVAPKKGFQHEVIDVRHPASSTAVRDAVRRGENLAGLVPPQVAHYIAQHRLYRESGVRKGG